VQNAAMLLTQQHISIFSVHNHYTKRPTLFVTMKMPNAYAPLVQNA